MDSFRILAIILVLVILGLGGVYLYTQANPVEINLNPDGRFVNIENSSSKILFDIDEPDGNIYSNDLIVEDVYQYVSPSDLRKIIKPTATGGSSTTNIFYDLSIFDSNVIGLTGAVTFVNQDGNALSVDDDFLYFKNSNYLLLKNFSGEGFCSSEYYDSYYCYDYFYDESSCNEINSCSWYDNSYCYDNYGSPSCYGTQTFTCASYSNESSCNGDAYGLCYWDSGTCYDYVSDCSYGSGYSDLCSYLGCSIEDCYSYDNSYSCENESLSGQCLWDYSTYCDGYFSCDEQTTESQCDLISEFGCEWDNNIQYSGVELGQVISTAPDGVEPIIINSNTKVNKLNADLFDDLDSDYYLQSSPNYLWLNQSTQQNMMGFPKWSNTEKVIGSVIQNSNHYGEGSAVSDLNNLTNVTMSYWIKSPTAPTGGYTKFQWNLGGIGGGISPRGNSAGTIQFDVQTSTGVNYLVTTTNTFWDNNWRLVTLTYDGNAIKLYVNGVLENTQVRTGTIINKFGNYLGFGYSGGTQRAYVGQTDGLAFYNRTLNQSEILDIFNYKIDLNGGGVFPSTNINTSTNLYHYFKFNNSLADSVRGGSWTFNSSISYFSGVVKDNQATFYNEYFDLDSNLTDFIYPKGTFKIGNKEAKNILNGDVFFDGNIFINNLKGINLNARILKDVNLISSVKTYCDLNFVGGLLVGGSC